MKRKNKTNRVVAFLAAAILTVFGLCQAAFAADTNTGNEANINLEEPVSLSIKLLKEDNEVAADKITTIELYQVGEWNGSEGKYVLTETFAPSGAKLEGEKGDDILREIETLSAYVEENSISPLLTGKTQNGQYTFSGLSMGLYMVASVSMEQAEINGDNSTITPFLISLPMWTAAGTAERGSWQYHVTASPKHSGISSGSEPGGNEPGGNEPGGNEPGGGVPGGNGPGGGGTSGGNGGGGSGSSGGGTGGGTNPGGTSTELINDEGTPLDGLDTQLENIDEEEIPLANPIAQFIEDVLVPLGLLPKTGDGSVSYAPLLALMAASGLLIFGFIWRKVRQAH